MDSIGNQLTNVVNDLQQRPEGSSVRPMGVERLSLSDAIEAVQRIISYYPLGSKDASNGYIGAMAAVLGDYPKAIAEKCADPRRGIVLSSTFLPAVAEIVAWCEKEAGRLVGEPRAYPVFPPLDPVSRDGRLSYEELKAKYGDGEGGWGIGATQRKVYPPVRQITKEEIQPTLYLLEVLERQRQPID
jgi:hypothetical protein